MRIIYCELCKERFECLSYSNNCWCKEFEVVTIDKKLKDCLCPKCLKKQERQSENNFTE